MAKKLAGHGSGLPDEIAGVANTNSFEVEVQSQFAFIQDTIDDWRAKAAKLKVTSIEEKEKMEQAALSEAMVKKVINTLDKKRVELKEEYLRKGQAVDKAAKTISVQLEEIRKDLAESAMFEKNFLEQQRLKRMEERRLALEPYNEPLTTDMLNADNDEFEMILSDVKIKFQKAEQQRLADEAKKLEDERLERERIQKIEEENRALKKQRDDMIALANERTKYLSSHGLHVHIEGHIIANLSSVPEKEFQAAVKNALAKKEKDDSERRDRRMLHDVRAKAIQQYIHWVPASVPLHDLSDLTAPEFSNILRDADIKRRKELSEERLKQLRQYDDPQNPTEYSGLDTLSKEDFEMVLMRSFEAFKTRIANQNPNVVDSSGMSERDKAMLMADNVRNLQVFEMSTVAGKELAENIKTMRTRMEAYIREKAYQKWPEN